MSNSCDLGILFCNTFLRIDHHDYHICALHSGHCTYNTISFQFLFYFAFSSKSCSINENIFSVLIGYLRIYGISGGSGYIRDDHSVFSQNLIDQRGFSHIRFSYHCDPGDLVFRLFFRYPLEMLCHPFQHISQPQHRSCRDWHRLADSQIIKFIGIHHKLLKTVNFIYDKDHRLPASAKHVCNLSVSIYQSLTDIRHKNNHICGINGDLCLFTHLGKNDILALRLNTSGID